MFLYRKILNQAWQATKHYKYLWFFGLFAVLLGNGGEIEIVFRNLNFDFSQGFVAGLASFYQTGVFKIQTLGNIGQLFQQDPLSLILALGVLLLLVLVGLFLIWLVIISQAALVNNYAKIANGKKHDFQEGVSVGMSKFWPVLTLNVVMKILTYLIFVLMSLPILANLSRSSSLVNGLLFILMFIVFVPIVMALSFIIKYAIGYIVIKGSNFTDAVKQGWDLFTKNWLVSLEMAFILFFINFAIGLGLILALMVLAIPFLFAAVLFVYSSLIFYFWATVALSLLALLAAIIGIGSILSVFQISSWTGLYLELTSQGAVSKIVRVFGTK